MRDHGLETKDIENIDSTIFCIPSEIVSKIFEHLKANGEKLLVDGKINENFFKYLEIQRKEKEHEKNPNGPPPLPLRRR